MRSEVALTIAGMALITYLTRSGGFWLLARIRPSPRLTAWLRALPGALMVALVTPSFVGAGLAGLLGAGITALIAVRTKNTLIAMIAGTAAVAVGRAAGG